MKTLALTGALALAFAPLTGCVTPGAAITATGNALADLAKNDIPTACGVIATAEGYYAVLEPFIAASNRAIEAKAAAIVAPICAAPPTDVASAFNTLLAEWTAIQAATQAASN